MNAINPNTIETEAFPTNLTTTTAPSGLPLDTLGGMIVAALNKSEDYIITAGKHLLEAQERVNGGEAGDIGWIRGIGRISKPRPPSTSNCGTPRNA